MEIFTRRAITEDEKVFELCDDNKKGYLDKEDIKVAILNLFGYKPSKYEVEQLMGSNKKDMPGLTEKKFQNLMEAKLSLEDLEQEHRQIFDILDIHYFEVGFASIAPHLSVSAISSCFNLLDKDGDGRVSYRDFEYCMRYPT